MKYRGPDRTPSLLEHKYSLWHPNDLLECRHEGLCNYTQASGFYLDIHINSNPSLTRGGGHTIPVASAIALAENLVLRAQTTGIWITTSTFVLTTTHTKIR